MAGDAAQFREALLAVDRERARRLFAEGLAGGLALDAVENMVVPALDAIGVGWEEGTVALSQVYMAGRICEELVQEALGAEKEQPERTPRVAVGVLEDFHFLGKRIVLSVLRAAGISVLDYGHITAEEAVRRPLEDGIGLLLLSTLMLPSALQVRRVTAGLEGRVQVVVGGAPFRFDPELWREVGADGTGATSAHALRLVRRWLEAHP